MAKKVRIYEIAREYGVSNEVVLELANELKIGATSHSASLEEAMGDRVRRLADSKGMTRQAPVKKAPAKKAPVKKAPAKKAPVKKAPVKKAPASKSAPDEEADAKIAPAVPNPTSRVVRSSARVEEPEAITPTPKIAPSASAIPSPPAATPESEVEPTAAKAKPIPPPPGQRRVPPPPVPGRSFSSGPRPGGAGPARRSPTDGTTGEAAAPRRSPGGYTPRPGPAATPGAGAPAGRPGGGRGRPTPQGQRPRRKKRRRRSFEELGPASAPVLTPIDAPVPEGEIVVPRGLTLQELAPMLNRNTADLVRLLFDAGELVTGTQSLADEMVDLIAETLNAEVLLVEPGQEQELELQGMLGDEEENEDESLLVPRAPIVTVMGHVDHGKTTLLDRIRSANVVAGEAGGITQHIGAYRAEHNSKPITFIDTPGHEAFTSMRARGAQATDVVVLVAAADDGLMPQTLEALNHARAADVPIIVAITKVDREDANPERVRQQFVENELVPEEWGGDTIMIDVSAPTGQGVDALLEAILLVAELEELSANPDAPARAFVLESNLDPGRGPVATVLIERGTLKVGAPVVAGGGWGRVRALFDEHGKSIKEAGLSMPVEVLGLDEVPLAGDELRVAPDEKTARLVAEARIHRRRSASSSHPASLAGGARLEDIFAMVQRGEVATLNLILKADVQGSLEAITDALRKLDKDHEEVRLSFVHRAVGGISESDIDLAAVSNATVIGFNVRPDRKARERAEFEKVELRLYEVIYKVLEDVNSALIGMLEPEFEEVVTGDAEVREIFGIPRVGKVAGCFVRNGVVTRGSKVRFLRDGVVIWNGAINSLRRFKDDAREVQAGFECGIGLSDFQDLKAGDIIETYDLKEIPRT